MALLGPLLVAVMLKVTLVFWFGTVLLTVLVTAMSAATGLMVALAESSPAVLSASFSAVLVAVLVVGASVFTVAVMVRVAVEPLARPPMFQIPVTGSYETELAETKVRPTGNLSVSWSPLAGWGPLLWAR